MSNALWTKIAVVAAATMITLTPALADRNDRGRNHNERGYSHNHRADNYGYGYGNRRHHHHRPYWMKRYYGWQYGYKPNRRWN